MPLPKVFPTDADLARVSAEHEYFKLYDCQPLVFEPLDDFTRFVLKEFFENDVKKASMLDRALHLAPTIVDSMTDLLLGEPFQVQIDGQDGVGNVEQPHEKIIERTQLRRKMSESSSLLQPVGHTHFQLYRDAEGNAAIEEVPYNYYFPEWDQVPLGGSPKIVRIVSYLTKGEGVTGQKYIYVQEHRMEGNTAVIEKSLWEEAGKKIGKQVPLSTLNIPSSGTPNEFYVIEDTGLDEIAIVSLHCRKTALHRYGQSVLKAVKPMLVEVNDRLRQLSLQFLKHLNAKLQIPESSIPTNPDGSINKVSMEVLKIRAGEPDAKYITNENPLIEQAFEYLNKLICQIAKLTQTPSLADDDKGGVETAEALKVRMMPLLKKVRFFELIYDPAIKSILRIAGKIEGIAEQKNLRILFDLGLPKDWQSDGAVWGDALASGIASKETAVRRFQGIQGEELKAEMKRIEDDATAMMESQLEMMDAEAAANGDPEEKKE